MLLVVANASGNENGITSSLACVVADINGCVLWEGQVWMQPRSASTDFLERTAAFKVCAVCAWLWKMPHNVSPLAVVCSIKAVAKAISHCSITHEWGCFKVRVIADAMGLDVCTHHICVEALRQAAKVGQRQPK